MSRSIFLVEIFDNKNDTTNGYTGYTLYQVFFCSEELIINFYDKIFFLPQKETVNLDS